MGEAAQVYESVGRRNVMIVDDTLREGMQTPGLVFSLKEKIEITKLLDAVGVPAIMTGYPPAHKSEFEAVKATASLSKQGRIRAVVIGHGRTMRQDVDAIVETGASIDIHFPWGFRPSNVELFDKVKDAISYARNRSDGEIKVSLIDVASLAVADLAKTTIEVAACGADVVSLPDTTGLLTPCCYFKIIQNVRQDLQEKYPKCKVAIHCHNDLGLAVANTLAGVYAGAEIVSATVGGLGERNGVPDLAVLASVLNKEGFPTGIHDSSQEMATLYEYVSEVVKKRIGLNLLDPRAPLFGEFVSVHTAGTHAGKVLSAAASGRPWSVSLTVYCGRNALRELTSKMGYKLTDDRLGQLMNMVKDASALKCAEIAPDELKDMVKSLQRCG